MRPAPDPIALAVDLLGERAASVLDVGARWGAAQSWYAVSPLVSVVGFEPDPDECARLNRDKTSPFVRYEPVALGDRDGKARLTITKEPGCSSLLPPDADIIERYPLLDVMRPVREVEVELTRLDTWAARSQRDDVAFMKLDVQGAELSILQGAGPVLDRCVGLEVEVEFFAIYRDQPLFTDVDSYLRSRGFSLWRLSNLVHYNEGPSLPRDREDAVVFNGDPAPFQAGPGRLCWANALFFRDPRSLDPKTGARELTLLAALLAAAREFDGMKACLSRLRSGGALEAPRQARLDSFLREWTAFEQQWLAEQKAPRGWIERLSKRLT